MHGPQNAFKYFQNDKKIPPFIIFLIHATFFLLIFSKIMCENKQQNAFKMLSRQKILLIPRLPFFFLRRKKNSYGENKI